MPQVSGQEDKSILEIILTRNYKYWAQQWNPNREGDQTKGTGYYHDLDNPYAWDQTDTTCDCPPHFGQVKYKHKNGQHERAELITRRRVRMEFDWTKHVGPAHACAPRPVTRHAPSHTTPRRHEAARPRQLHPPRAVGRLASSPTLTPRGVHVWRASAAAGRVRARACSAGSTRTFS